MDAKGEILELKNTLNTMVDRLNSFADEVTRVAREVGTEGKLGGQAKVKGVSGTWKDLTESVNQMATNLTSQVRNIAEVTTAVARGDLTRKVTVDVRGEILDLKITFNTMLDQLNSFADEVTRVAREVGTEGRLGGQADVRGVTGMWKDLTESVNTMATNLTNQVRGIAEVVTSVADGNLQRKLALQARGEIAKLADTINAMIVTLSTFSDQVISVAREVGVEGRLGGQAVVPGVAGTWRELTDNVNLLAGNLTSQVRAIKDVAIAVTSGDLTRTIEVEARGEVEELRNTVNTMIVNLKDTTMKTREQDWLKTNLARFAGMFQGQRNLTAVANTVLSELARLVDAQHGIFYVLEEEESRPVLKLLAAYAYQERKHVSNRYLMGEGLVGQCALEKQRILLTEVPADYIQITSGLGEAKPFQIIVLPIIFETQPLAVLELATFQRFSEVQITFLDQLAESLGIAFNTIAATMRTETLLGKSQSLTEELQTQQEELQQANEELAEKARLLEVQKKEVETKNREIDLARQSVSEKAEQLALTSKYKSEFLANMSHELRTPLNSLLILARMLVDNSEGNLTEKQMEFARTIHASGTDLLSLINEILDLSKIEAGAMDVDVRDVPFTDLADYVEKTFRHMAEERRLEFAVELAPGLPQEVRTDEKRLQQVLRNLLGNAFKFTEKGEVKVRIAPAAPPARGFDNDILRRADQVIAFSVQDSGIGIPKDKLQVIFEAFQQAEGGTSRKYGGTGLGLSISREIARLLGGEIRVESAPDQGSTFTLYLPRVFVAPADKPAVPVSAAAAPVPPASSQAVEELFEARPFDIVDDRNAIEAGDRVLLIVEDDEIFARILLDQARTRGFKGVVSVTGETALTLAKRLKPDAITLDIRLPGMSGWVVLGRLKHDAETRHIPIHIISVEEERYRGLKLGAIGYLVKPATKEAVDEAMSNLASFVDRPARRLLLVEDDETHRKSLLELLGNGDIVTTAAGTAAEALAALGQEKFDCMVLDLGLPDMPGIDLIQKIRKDLGRSDLPIIIYTGRELTRKEETQLRKVSEAIIIKGIKSPERLMDETALFLHRIEANLPEEKRRMMRQVQMEDPTLAGRKVLVVDDDVRNIFALTSVLAQHQMKVVYAENGRDGIERLKENPDADVVLMDIMMPEMDGYEAMRAIRALPEHARLPIFALTAKAMKGDRERCVGAGASDYIPKPVDVEQLLSLLRVWLYRK